jgi:hypothetical protein
VKNHFPAFPERLFFGFRKARKPPDRAQELPAQPMRLRAAIRMLIAANT